MAQRVLDPGPPILDHNMYRYQMSGGPSYVGMDNPPVEQETSPLGSIMGLRHQLPATFPVSEPTQTRAQSIGPSYEELTAQGFRGAEVRPNAAQRGEATPEMVPNGFDQGRFGPEYGSPQWGGEEVGSSSADPAMAPPPADAGGMPPPPSSGGMGRLGPILNGLGAGIAANNMGVGVGVMNNRRDILYRRQQYEYERNLAMQEEQRKQAEAIKRNTATVSFLEKMAKNGKVDPALVDLVRDNPEFAGEAFREAMQDAPGPLTEIGKVRLAVKNNEITQEEGDAIINSVLNPGANFDDTAKLRDTFDKNEAVIAYRKGKVAYNKMLAAARQASGAGDMAAMFNFIKSIDPTGQVTQNDYGALQSATGWGQNLIAAYNNLQTLGKSGKVTAESRRQFVEAARAQLNAAAALAQEEAARYTKLARLSRADPSQVILDDGFGEMPETKLEEFMSPEELERSRAQQESDQILNGGPVQGSATPQGAPAQRPRQGVARPVGRYNPATGKVEYY